MWICIRDEPVVYVDGIPTVLREGARPLQNMRAFTGITGDRVALLESKIVDDVRSEQKRHHGMTVVHEEHRIH